MTSLRVSASPREDSPRRSPLLRLEVRQRNTRRRNFVLCLALPLVLAASLGFGAACAAMGLFQACFLVASSAALGWMFHSATRPLV